MLHSCSGREWSQFHFWDPVKLKKIKHDRAEPEAFATEYIVAASNG
jgi:hypothetical protein